MLATNFKSADELGLSEKGYRALHRVLRMLESGELVYTPLNHFVPKGFNMNATWEENECGTIGCIGGWAGFYDKKGWTGEPINRSAFAGESLFCPRRRVNHDYTVEEAAHALRAYLVTGIPDWSSGKSEPINALRLRRDTAPSVLN